MHANGWPPSPPTPRLGPALLGAWLLMLFTFSVPGREGPSTVGGMDLIALAKLATRGVVFVILVAALVRSWGHPRRPLVGWCLAPFALFLGWCFVSVLWSPLQTVSVGQASGLLVLVLLTAVLGLAGVGRRGTSTVLCHLSGALLLMSAVLLAVHLVAPDASGLSREPAGDEGSLGLMHPTSAGSTAALGLIMLTAGRLLWGWRWSRVLLVPGVGVHGAVLLLAASRTAVILATVAVAALVAVCIPRRWLARSLVAVSIAGTTYLVLDPSLDVVEGMSRSVTVYLRRGESAELILTLTGRTDLWEAIWKSFQESPLIGHGYFVTSRTGEINVWSGPANRTAHNVLLQVLVTTGLVGGGLFLWGLGRPVAAAGRDLGGKRGTVRLAVFLTVIGLWYMGWGQLCESFMGPVQPEAVVFFTVLGLAIGAVPVGRAEP